MPDGDERNPQAKTKAVLVDPGSMTVVWMNEPAAQGLPDPSAVGMPVDEAIPMVEALGVPEALRTVASTGVAQQLSADIVSTVRGSVAMVLSIYRLPTGQLLILLENAWQMGRESNTDSRPRRSGRRSR